MTVFGDLFELSGLPSLQSVHGETVTYRSEGVADRSIVVTIDEVTEPQEEPGKQTKLVLRMKVKLSTDAVLGIENPRIGDSIVRGELAFAFRGKILNGNAGCWHLEFERAMPKKFG